MNNKTRLLATCVCACVLLLAFASCLTGCAPQGQKISSNAVFYFDVTDQPAATSQPSQAANTVYVMVDGNGEYAEQIESILISHDVPAVKLSGVNALHDETSSNAIFLHVDTTSESVATQLPAILENFSNSGYTFGTWSYSDFTY